MFGAIYVGAIPFFLLSTGWMVQRPRSGRSVVVPIRELSGKRTYISATRRITSGELLK